jgi:GNAT superfamily N-acetyltransferase
MNIVNAKGAYDIRPAEEGDLDYILSSWQLTWERSPEMNLPGMIRDEYFRHAHLMLDELISRSSENRALYICHQPGSPHLIRGYLCGEVRSWENVHVAYLHWIQVKKPDWRKGVGSALVERFRKDFNIGEDQNMLYTFANSAVRNQGIWEAARDLNLVYWPWFKYTSQEYGWESGQ